MTGDQFTSEAPMIRIAVVGLGKMGLSHHALFHAHPDAEVTVCDQSKYVLGVLAKNIGVSTYDDYDRMLARRRSMRW